MRDTWNSYLFDYVTLHRPNPYIYVYISIYVCISYTNVHACINHLSILYFKEIEFY